MFELQGATRGGVLGTLVGALIVSFSLSGALAQQQDAPTAAPAPSAFGVVNVSIDAIHFGVIAHRSWIRFHIARAA